MNPNIYKKKFKNYINEEFEELLFKSYNIKLMYISEDKIMIFFSEILMNLNDFK
jgi:hypothetical protein